LRPCETLGGVRHAEVVVHACREAGFAIADDGVRRERDDRHAGPGAAFLLADPAGGFEAVQRGQVAVHEDHVVVAGPPLGLRGATVGEDVADACLHLRLEHRLGDGACDARGTLGSGSLDVANRTEQDSPA